MFTKKDRKIANQKAMIENRDKLIDNLSNKKDVLMKENIAVYQENKELRYENDELSTTVKNIQRLMNDYVANNTNPFTLIRDIKIELDASGKCI